MTRAPTQIKSPPTRSHLKQVHKLRQAPAISQIKAPASYQEKTLEELKSDVRTQSDTNDQRATHPQRNQLRAHTPAFTPRKRNPKNTLQLMTIQLMTYAMLVGKKTKPLVKRNMPWIEKTYFLRRIRLTN